MAESTPHLAPIVVLLFLGSMLLTGVSLLVLLMGAVRRSKLLPRVGAGTASTVVAGYMLLLLGVSLTVLPEGGWKCFCELDCHSAYSVESAETAATVGPELQPVPARGKFALVRLKIWFDEHTISPHRGDGPAWIQPRISPLPSIL
jgi:hypothetical protein